MICRQYQCVFVHIPKAAGQSIEQFFMNRLGLDWDRDREQLYLHNNDDPARGTEKLGHLAASEYVSCGHMSQPIRFLLQVQLRSKPLGTHTQRVPISQLFPSPQLSQFRTPQNA